ncbi:MAG: TonB-dependent receptor [Opitutae bacterium]|nr:TonB-dependent receptor [Opitutae bacterium]
MRTLRHLLRAFVFGAFLTAVVFAADEQKKNYDIPAGDAVVALKRFAALSGRETLFAAETVRGVKTSAVKGELTAQEALAALLGGTGLISSIDTKTGAVAVRRGYSAESKNAPSRLADAKAAPKDGPVMLGNFEVRSSRVDGLINKGVIPTNEDAPIYHDVIDRIDIERMGATNVEEVIRNTPELTGYSSANQEASVVQIVGPSSLSSNLSLRGFDSQQTTVLINGRRVARSQFPNLVGASSGDLSRIPLSAIERIEIMPMSGSAMYGGGAIGGVVNVILRKNYSGRELTTQFGTSTEGGSTEFNATYLHGFSVHDGRTTGTFTLNYRDRGPLTFADRPDMLNRALAHLATESAISAFTDMPGMIRVTAATGDLGIPGRSGIRYAMLPAGLTLAQANALTPADFVATAGKFTPTFERFKNNYLYTPSKAFTASFSGEHQLVPDCLTAYGEFIFTANRQDIENPKFYGTGTTLTLSATHPFNPFRTGVTPGFIGRSVAVNLLMVDARPSTTAMKRDTYRAVAGLKGKLGEKWDWSLDGTSEVAVIRGDSQVGADNINLASFFSAVANPATFADRWALYQPLADHRANPVAASVNENYFNVVAQQRYWQYASNLIARFSGDVYDWRAGTVKTSLGAEAYWWQYEGKRPYIYPKTLADIMGTSLPRDIAYSRQSRRTDAVFGELVVPVISKRWRPLPVESLDLNFSARHESADDSKAAVTTAVAAKLAMTRDVAFRASYTEGFFPPEQGSLFTSDYGFSTFFTSTTTVTDPRRGNTSQTYTVDVNTGPNPGLRPETSKAANFGIIFTPRWLTGLRFSIDYWDIKKHDAIRSPSFSDLLLNEGEFPDRITRAAPIPDDPAGWAGPITAFDTRMINMALVQTDGYDLNASYRAQTRALGEITFSSRATYTDKVRSRVSPAARPVERVGTNEGALNWRGTASLFWEKGAWRAGVTARYIDSFHTSTTAPSTQYPTASGADGAHIASDLTWDFQVGYRVAYGNQKRGWRGILSGTAWRLVVNNAFNRMPPWYSSGYYSRFSDPRMRYISLEVKKTL